jgi:4-hydroxy-4-methyl-2-oxoglutarate aldolase
MKTLDSFPLECLCAGMFSDNLDKLGRKHCVAASWHSNFAPFRCQGRARTVRLETLETDDENITTGLSFIEMIQPGEVLVIEGSTAFAYFGELMTRLSVRQGVAAVIIEGLTRDSIHTFTERRLPILFRGLSPVDIKGRGRVAATDVPVIIGGISVHPGDFVFADSDAAVFVPRDCENALAERIDTTLADEKDVIALIDQGATVEEILRRVKEF